jgi:hypothetical protein
MVGADDVRPRSRWPCTARAKYIRRSDYQGLAPHMLLLPSPPCLCPTQRAGSVLVISSEEGGLYGRGA